MPIKGILNDPKHCVHLSSVRSKAHFQFFNQACAWFLELLLSVKLVCVCVCVRVCVHVCVCVRVCAHACVSAPKAINYILVILNLYNQLNKFVAFRNVTKLSMHRRGLCNKARRDRNQPYKAMVVL